MSKLKVFVLMAGLTALFVAIGGALGGQSGMSFALLFAGVMNFLARKDRLLSGSDGGV